MHDERAAAAVTGDRRQRHADGHRRHGGHRRRHLHGHQPPGDGLAADQQGRRRPARRLHRRWRPRRSPARTTAAPGSPGRSATLTTATPVVISNIPAGRTCTVTETPPTGGLANASYAWGAPTFSDAAGHDRRPGHGQRDDHEPRRAAFGTFSLTKAVVGPERSATPAAPSRVFPVAYSCTLTERRRRRPARSNVTLGAGGVAGRADPRRFGVHVHRDADRSAGRLQPTPATCGRARRSARRRSPSATAPRRRSRSPTPTSASSARW